jgi:hypothetical protein
MENGPKIKISQKMHCLMDFWIIRDHFTIVIWQQYLLYSGLRTGSLFTAVVSSMKGNAMEDDYYTEAESVPRSKAARGLERCR